MSNMPNCPKCESQYTYQEMESFVCPECSHEWTVAEREIENDGLNIKDANGNILRDYDTVSVIKDLKI